MAGDADGNGLTLSFLVLPFDMSRFLFDVFAFAFVLVRVVIALGEMFVRGTVNGGVVSSGSATAVDAVADAPNVVCTKFVGFLNIFVKLLVLNESKPLAVLFDSVPLVASFLIRFDFALGLNIILSLYATTPVQFVCLCCGFANETKTKHHTQITNEGHSIFARSNRGGCR